MLNTTYKRFFFATLIWLFSWPILWFVKIGDITGPKAWFWIVGELSYPVVAVAFLLIDGVFKSLGAKPWVTFVGTVAIIAVCMPFYYEKYGFSLGVSIEARFL